MPIRDPRVKSTKPCRCSAGFSTSRNCSQAHRVKGSFLRLYWLQVCNSVHLETLPSRAIEDSRSDTSHRFSAARLNSWKLTNSLLQLLESTLISELHSLFSQASAQKIECSSQYLFPASVILFVTRCAPEMYYTYCTLPRKLAKDSTQYAWHICKQLQHSVLTLVHCV